MADPNNIHDTTQQDFTEYYEQSLSAQRQQEIATHLGECSVCHGAYEQFERTVSALSGLHKMSAPQHFGDAVETTIRKRSAGRFFGRRAFGDRVPFGVLAIAALVIGVIIVLLMRYSDLGTLSF